MRKRIIALLLCAAVILSSGCSANSDSLPDNTSKEYTSSEPVSDTTDTSGGISDDSSQQTQTDADSTAMADGTSEPKPTETTESKTEASSNKPASSSNKPASSTDKPASSTNKPASSTDKPASSTNKPASSSDKPVSSTDKPASSLDKPASSSDKPASSSSSKQTTTKQTTTTKQPTSDKPQSYSQSYEAENGSFSSDMSVISNDSASGNKTVGKFENSSSYWKIEISVPQTAVYDIVIRSSGIGDNKENNLLIDGAAIGSFSSKNGSMQDYTVSSVNISKGTHTLKITKSWGWIELDRITVKSAETISDSTYNVTSSLVNAKATAETKKLYQFLKDSYGKYVIAGQQCDGGIYGTEFSAIKAVTGKYPALIGLDMMDYTPSRTALGARSTAVEKAIEFSNKGGIVTFCWHWNSPTEYLKDGNDPENNNPRWWGGFYTRNTNFDIAKVMNGQDEKGKKLLDADIKEIAAQLKRLEGVPVLWRPLHEASGGWFWWGAKGADAYKKLWRYLYKQLTDLYKCNNLIWVYNGQSADWYPGDEYVDIVGEDIYPGKRVYNPQTSRFRQAVAYGSKNKITALTENGCIFDIDQAVGVNCMWSWFCTWGGEFTVNGSSYSEQYTEKSILKKAYQSEYVLTLDELPDIY